MPDSPPAPAKQDRKPDTDAKQGRGGEAWPFSPSNPPDLHAKPLIKSHIDREGLRKALEQVGVKAD